MFLVRSVDLCWLPISCWLRSDPLPKESMRYICQEGWRLHLVVVLQTSHMIGLWPLNQKFPGRRFVLREQERCQPSIVLRGFWTGCEEVVKEKFAKVCLALDIGDVQLSGLVSIGKTCLFRAKVLNCN